MNINNAVQYSSPTLFHHEYNKLITSAPIYKSYNMLRILGTDTPKLTGLAPFIHTLRCTALPSRLRSDNTWPRVSLSILTKIALVMDCLLPREKDLTKQHTIATEILLHLDLLGLSSFQKGTLIRQRVLSTIEDTDDESWAIVWLHTLSGHPQDCGDLGATMRTYANAVLFLNRSATCGHNLWDWACLLLLRIYIYVFFSSSRYCYRFIYKPLIELSVAICPKGVKQFLALTFPTVPLYLAQIARTPWEYW